MRIRYGSAVALSFGFNFEQFAWELNRDGTLDKLEQRLRIGMHQERQVVDASFDGRTGQTKIRVRDPVHQPPIRTTGHLSISY